VSLFCWDDEACNGISGVAKRLTISPITPKLHMRERSKIGIGNLSFT